MINIGICAEQTMGHKNMNLFPNYEKAKMIE